MRQAIHILVFGLLFFSVRSCGVNQTYDQMKFGAESVSEKVGVPAAGRAWNEKIYPAVVGTASRTVHQGSAATFEGAERVVNGADGDSGGMRGRLRKAVAAIKQGFRDLIGGPSTPSAQSPATGSGG